MPTALMETPTQFDLRLASRMSRLGTETAFEVLNRAKNLEKQGRQIIHLEIGEPDFATPDNIVNAAVDALHKGWTHYGPSAGLPELREAIAAYIGSTRGTDVDPALVVVTPGGTRIHSLTVASGSRKAPCGSICTVISPRSTPFAWTETMSSCNRAGGGRIAALAGVAV